MWIALALVSCVFLGFYDISKKLSVNNNAIIPVLFLSSLSSTFLFIPLILGSNWGLIATDSIVFVPKANLNDHFIAFAKALLVGTSWIFSFKALKHLPITIVTPIRATGPVWTLLGAMLIYGERYGILQWIGIIVVFAFFYYFSTIGKLDGINFRSNRWIWYIIVATLLGAASGLFDKFIFREYHRMTIQAWFMIYLAVFYLPFLLFNWYPKRKERNPFQWRWSIPFIGILLSLADFAYFYALTYPDSSIALVSLLRRGSVIIAFSAGVFIFKEKNIKRKVLALAGILIGIVLIVLGS